MLTKNNLIIVEVDSKDSNKISSLVNHSLGTILNIKCRKKRPDLIIFEYSGAEKDIDRLIFNILSCLQYAKSWVIIVIIYLIPNIHTLIFKR